MFAGSGHDNNQLESSHMIDQGPALVLFILVGLASVAASGSAAGVMAPSIVAFTLRLAAALVVFGTVGLFSPDAEYYDSLARQIVAGPVSVEITAGKEGWPYLLAGIYSTFGPHPALGLVVSATLGALVVPVVARTSLLLGLPSGGASWLAALFPMTIVWSSLLLRESLTWLLLALCTWCLAGLVTAKLRWPYAVGLIAALTVLSTARGPAVLIMVLGGFIALFTLFRWRERFVLTALTIAGFGLILLSPLRSFWLEVLGNSSPETVADGAGILRESSTAFPEVRSSGLLGTLESLWIASPRVIAGPLVWEWPWLPLPLIADGVLWVVIIVLAVVGIKSLNKRMHAIVMISPASLFLASLIVGSGNYGTMQRLRMQAVIILLPLTGAGIERMWNAILHRSPILTSPTQALPEEGPEASRSHPICGRYKATTPRIFNVIPSSRSAKTRSRSNVYSHN